MPVPFTKYKCPCGNFLYGRTIQPDRYTGPEWEGDEECPRCGRGVDEASVVLPEGVTLSSDLPVTVEDFGPAQAPDGTSEDVPF